MIDPKQLLTDLQKLLKRLEPDIRNRCEASADIDARLRNEYDRAKSANRTAQAYEVWRDDYITQVAVSWILGCVFVRFLEDNHLIETVWLAGPGSRLQLARDQHTLYFQKNPTQSDREYLEHVFKETAKLPSMRDLLDGTHNPISKLGPTGDGARELSEFWQRVDPSTGVLIHDFTDPECSTRFLGDLYQDLSESARDRYALLQTPEFVEEFILDRTLTPAVQEFGYATVKMIDPACGSGHFLLGGFRRLLQLRQRNEPGINVRAQVEAVLGQVFGVDVNPFAIAIARFRLLIAALKECEVKNLSAAPNFQINATCGDSLLHGPSPRGLVGIQRPFDDDPLQHYYDIEDAESVRRFLSQRYHIVVGNPPYIAPPDVTLSDAYRLTYATCYRNYQLSIPFIERFFDLSSIDSESTSAGYVGLIVSRAFMKKIFGKPLIENYLPHRELTHIIDTSGVDIPGHETPTVILFARNRPPRVGSIRVARSVRSETGSRSASDSAPVWASIVSEIDKPGFSGTFAEVEDVPRSTFARWPWSLDGGGAAQLKAMIENAGTKSLKDWATAIGRISVLGEEDAWFTGQSKAQTHRIREYTQSFVIGEHIRNWSIEEPLRVLYPYESLGGNPLSALPEPLLRRLWPNRELLRRRRIFKKTLVEHGRHWFELLEHYTSKLRVPTSIAFGYIATHNHFVLDPGGKLFDRHGTVIKLRDSTPAESYFGLLGLLNSSVSCFWLKQVSEPKSGWTEFWEARFEFDGSKLKGFPIPTSWPDDLARQIHQHAERRASLAPSRLLTAHLADLAVLREARAQADTLSKMMTAFQEEMDWKCYKVYGITADEYTSLETAVPPLQFGERAFEIVLARKMAAGEAETNWFERHGAKPLTELPTHWSTEYRAVVAARIDAIERDQRIQLLEQPEYKRRWNAVSWEQRERQALQDWLVSRIEDGTHWYGLHLTSCAKLADYLRTDADFARVAELFRGRADFDWTALVIELTQPESVPFIATLRLTQAGLRKRSIWESVWRLQRAQDRIDAEIQSDESIPETRRAEIAFQRKAEEVGEIPPPPRYDAGDFQKPSYWLMRGKLDVPKERFISFPFCERDADATPVIGWAGWNDLQQAQAIAAYYERVKNQEGWKAERRVPLLAGLLELLPWLKQWHNDIHPEYHERMGDFFQQFIEDEARAMDMTVDAIRGWTPPAQSRSRGRRKRNS